MPDKIHQLPVLPTFGSVGLLSGTVTPHHSFGKTEYVFGFKYLNYYCILIFFLGTLMPHIPEIDMSSKRAELTAHWKFPRWKAAQKRHKLSSPITAAIAKKIITKDDFIFDYGCGRGDVPRILTEQGYKSMGFDPYYFPDNPILSADVVNLSFVLATIEDPIERDEVLVKAWGLTHKHLIVAAQVQHSRGEEVWGDGFITKWTFVKYWTSPEFRKYIESVLDEKITRIGKGIFVVSR